jgi:hypothetical protein
MNLSPRRFNALRVEKSAAGIKGGYASEKDKNNSFDAFPCHHLRIPILHHKE